MIWYWIKIVAKNILFIYLKSVYKWIFLYKWPMYDHSWPFFAKCMFIFHKTEVLTVILKCLTGLTYDWFKNYDTKCKYFNSGFVQKQMFASFAFFAFLCFLSKILYQLKFRLVQHLKMTVWTSVLWQIDM